MSPTLRLAIWATLTVAMVVLIPAAAAVSRWRDRRRGGAR